MNGSGETKTRWEVCRGTAVTARPQVGTFNGELAVSCVLQGSTVLFVRRPLTGAMEGDCGSFGLCRSLGPVWTLVCKTKVVAGFRLRKTAPINAHNGLIGAVGSGLFWSALFYSGLTGMSIEMAKGAQVSTYYDLTCHKQATKTYRRPRSSPSAQVTKVKTLCPPPKSSSYSSVRPALDVRINLPH